MNQLKFLRELEVNFFKKITYLKLQFYDGNIKMTIFNYNNENKVFI